MEDSSRTIVTVLATPLRPPQRLAEACKIDISHNVGDKVITVGIVIMIPLCAVLNVANRYNYANHYNPITYVTINRYTN